MAFSVRTCANVAEAVKYFHGWAVSEHWDHGQDGLDTEHVFYPCHPEGFFVGSLQEQGGEQVVSSVCALKHGDIGYIAFYIVGDPQHRKKGYAIRAFQHALDHMAPCPWIGLCAVSAQVETYKRSGFIAQEPITRYIGNRAASGTQTPTVDLGCVSLEQLIDIDHRYSGIYRPVFITHWIHYHIAEMHCFGQAIVDDQGQVVALACMRRCVSGSYRVAPVYANTAEHACALVAKLTSLVDQDAQFVTDVHVANPVAKDMFENTLGWKPLSAMMVMHTMWRKGPGASADAPKLDSVGCFSIASPESG